MFDGTQGGSVRSRFDLAIKDSSNGRQVLDGHHVRVSTRDVVDSDFAANVGIPFGDRTRFCGISELGAQEDGMTFVQFRCEGLHQWA